MLEAVCQTFAKTSPSHIAWLAGKKRENKSKTCQLPKSGRAWGKNEGWDMLSVQLDWEVIRHAKPKTVNTSQTWRQSKRACIHSSHFLLLAGLHSIPSFLFLVNLWNSLFLVNLRKSDIQLHNLLLCKKICFCPHISRYLSLDLTCRHIVGE